MQSDGHLLPVCLLYQRTGGTRGQRRGTDQLDKTSKGILANGPKGKASSPFRRRRALHRQGRRHGKNGVLSSLCLAHQLRKRPGERYHGRYPVARVLQPGHHTALDEGGVGTLRLTEISWLRRVRERKSLVCKPTLQKVSTTFWALSLVLLRLRRPVASGSVGAVGSATASPVFPVL